jgi:hypothetical protein
MNLRDSIPPAEVEQIQGTRDVRVDVLACAVERSLVDHLAAVTQRRRESRAYSSIPASAVTRRVSCLGPVTTRIIRYDVHSRP